MIKQYFLVEIDENTYKIEYSYNKFLGKTTFSVDDDEFSTRGHAFGIGVARSEMIIIGMTQGALSIDKKGRARLICRDADSVREVEGFDDPEPCEA